MNNIKEIKNYFEELSIEDIQDIDFIENKLLLQLGLNNEVLYEQPIELEEHYGKGYGLRIWQYPNQFSKYLKFVSNYAPKINSYLEIGCRYGGTFITHTEYFNKLNANFKKSVAVDIIDIYPLLEEYICLTNKCEYVKNNSMSYEFKQYIHNNFFDMIFIDGDHGYEGVINDALITKDRCNIQVFHDIISDACPGVGVCWEQVKSSYSNTHDFYEFNDQYESVSGSFLGIGVAVRKEWINEI